MRMETAQHIAHHARAFHRLGPGVAVGTAKAQTHARHGIQNPPLHRLLAVADIGQRAALDHAQGVFQVGALGVGGQVQFIVTLGGRVDRSQKVVGHSVGFKREGNTS